MEARFLFRTYEEDIEMIKGKEVRSNGILIVKKEREGSIPQYHVQGSPNGPWDYLRNARRDADQLKPN